MSFSNYMCPPSRCNRSRTGRGGEEVIQGPQPPVMICLQPQRVIRFDGAYLRFTGELRIEHRRADTVAAVARPARSGMPAYGEFMRRLRPPRL